MLEKTSCVAFFTGLEALDGAGRAIFSPGPCIELLVAIERRDQDVSLTVITLGKSGIAGEPKNNLVQHERFLCQKTSSSAAE